MNHEWVTTHKHPSGSLKEPDGVDCSKCGLSAMRWAGALYIATENVAMALFKKTDVKDIPRVNLECMGRVVHILAKGGEHMRCGIQTTTGPSGTWGVRSLEKHPEEGHHATCYKCRNSCSLCGGPNAFLSLKPCLKCYLARRELLTLLHERVCPSERERT